MTIKISFNNGQKLPMIVEPLVNDKGVDLGKLLKKERDLVRQSLLVYGAVLFRGFDVKSVEKFKFDVRCFAEKELLAYAGGVSPRTALAGGGVYSSTDYPPHLQLSLHNELSYSRVYPEHLYFFCLTAPQKGGETTLGDSRRIFQKISPEISKLFC